jgi:glucose/mannose-6-phosphate isomerase
VNLDDLALIDDIDPSGMLAHIRGFPQHCRAAWDHISEWTPPPDWGSIRHVLITGMGGSAIGGTLVQGLVSGASGVPILVWRNYGLPAFVQGPEHLVVACSYSGNTEETLTAFREGLRRGASTVAITTGGELAELARRGGAALVQFDYESEPRAALGYSFFHLLGVVSRGLALEDYTNDVREAVQVMESWQSEIAPAVPTDRNAAKELALRAHSRQLVVFGAGYLSGVANRWKTQVNENAKHWAAFEALPELNHNTVCGLGIPQAVRDLTLVVMLRSATEHTRLQARWNVTSELLAREGVDTQTVYGRGEGALSQMLSLIHFGDLVSFYLAVLNGEDPTPVESIAFLKQRLAEQGLAEAARHD